MDEAYLAKAREVARMTGAFHQQVTGYAPRAVTVVMGGDTLVSTLHDALTPAEREMARNPAGAARVQEYHRQIFADSVGPLRQEIRKITGMEVRGAAAEVEPTTGTVVHAFTDAPAVQVFLLAQDRCEDAWKEGCPGPALDDEEMDDALNALALAASNLALVLAIGGGATEIAGAEEGRRV
jgi:uncharacterized protein YbcI